MKALKNKKSMAVSLTLSLLIIWAIPPHVSADSDKHCTPQNIRYCKKEKTWSGDKFTSYTVHCSDGSKRKISAWDKRKKWCVGTSKRRCTTDQLKAAKLACQSK